MEESVLHRSNSRNKYNVWKWLLQKHDGKMWIALVSLRIRASSGYL